MNYLISNKFGDRLLFVEASSTAQTLRWTAAVAKAMRFESAEAAGAGPRGLENWLQTMFPRRAVLRLEEAELMAAGVTAPAPARAVHYDKTPFGLGREPLCHATDRDGKGWARGRYTAHAGLVTCKRCKASLEKLKAAEYAAAVAISQEVVAYCLDKLKADAPGGASY